MLNNFYLFFLNIILGFLSYGILESSFMLFLTPHLVVMVFYMVFIFVISSLFLIFIQLDYLGFIGIIVYAGAIAVLFLFVIMLMALIVERPLIKKPFIMNIRFFILFILFILFFFNDYSSADFLINFDTYFCNYYGNLLNNGFFKTSVLEKIFICKTEIINNFEYTKNFIFNKGLTELLFIEKLGYLMFGKNLGLSVVFLAFILLIAMVGIFTLIGESLLMKENKELVKNKIQKEFKQLLRLIK